MADCRRTPPAELCSICRQVNEGCTIYCRDVFIYDQTIPAEEIAEVLKDNYVVGGKGGKLETASKIPERILALLEAPEGPYAEIARMVRRLRVACELRALMEDITSEKPLDYAGYTIEWNPYEPSVLKISSHLNGEHHTYLEISPTRDISITLSLPREDDCHKLSLRKGQEPVYSHDSSKVNNGFPEQRFLAWLERAIEDMNV